MSISAKPEALVNDVSFNEHEMCVSLLDGRRIFVPLEWFPKLHSASKVELDNWRIIAGGVGIHWESLDEDVSVEGLLAA